MARCFGPSCEWEILWKIRFPEYKLHVDDNVWDASLNVENIKQWGFQRDRPWRFIQEVSVEWQIFQGRQSSGIPHISSSWEATKSKKNPLNLCPWVLKRYLKASIFLTKKVRVGCRGRAGTKPNGIMMFLKRMFWFLLPAGICTREVQKETCQKFRSIDARGTCWLMAQPPPLSAHDFGMRTSPASSGPHIQPQLRRNEGEFYVKIDTRKRPWLLEGEGTPLLTCQWQKRRTRGKNSFNAYTSSLTPLCLLCTLI